LLALFTHNHLFWIAGLFLAMIDLPDLSTPLRSIARSVASIAGIPPDTNAPASPHHGAAGIDAPDPGKEHTSASKGRDHA
jgi:hypothetical protein